MAPFAQPFRELPVAYEIGGCGRERARVVCCFLGCGERPYNPLLTALPAVIHLSASSAEAANGSLGALLPIAAVESGRARPGGENVLSRLSELMFVEAIRRYIEMLPASCTGWVAGLRDTILGQALVALHTNRASCGQSNGWHGSWACLDQCLRSDSRRWWVTHQCTTSHSGGCNLLPAW
jgi:hypothetical protein